MGFFHVLMWGFSKGSLPEAMTSADPDFSDCTHFMQKVISQSPRSQQTPYIHLEWGEDVEEGEWMQILYIECGGRV